MLFSSHQVSRRGYSKFSSGSATKPYRSREWAPNRLTSSGFSGDDNERVASMRILDVLLANGPDVHACALGFCTPLHCAANSGWLSHAIALVNVGARVYTGPECSPLCWVKDGSSGSHPLARYLRVELGDRGLTMIEQDHARLSGEPPRKVLPRNEEPLFRTQTDLTIGPSGLCSICSEMSLESIIRPPGFKHLSSFDAVKRNASSCKFCRIIVSSLDNSQSRSLGSQSQVLISASHKPGRSIDTLEIKLSSGCRCNPQVPYASPDFSQCHGTCNMAQTGKVIIFTKEGKQHYVGASGQHV